MTPTSPKIRLVDSLVRMLHALASRAARLSAVALTIAMLTASSTASNARAATWRPLFNGRDLTGWKTINGSALYAVMDGAIVGTAVAGSPNSFLAHEESFGDFVLEFEVKQEVGPSNSGVQFRSASRPDFENGRVYGYQCEIDPSERGYTGGIYDETRRGWLYPVSLNPSARSLFQFGRWNHFRIEAIGQSLRTWVNGVPVAHLIDNASPSGLIALQIHSINNSEDAGRRVLWRNIRIQTDDLRPAAPDPIFIRNTIPNHLSEAERAQGWTLLWDGSTTRGWRGAHKKEFPSHGWKIENGELIVVESGGAEARNGGDIVTESMYSTFEVQLEVKLTPGANSGIKYFVTEEIDPGGGSAYGLEYQLLDDERHPDAKLGAAGNRTLASVYDLIPSRKITGGLGLVPRLDGWLHARLVVRPDDVIEHWLNGIQVVEYERPSPALAAMVARSKYSNLPSFGLAREGRLLLQDHGNTVHFRSIKIRPLR